MFVSVASSGNPSLRYFFAGAIALALALPSGVRAAGPVIPFGTFLQSSGPLQIFACPTQVSGSANQILLATAMVHNRTDRKLIRAVIRFRGYDASSIKQFDDLEVADTFTLDPAESGSYVANRVPGVFSPEVVKSKKVVCSIERADFAGGFVWVPGRPFRGKLFPKMVPKTPTP